MLSLIATVYNEGDNLHRLLESLTRQTRQPEEVVIVDGGSTDNTVAILNQYKDQLPLKIIVEPGANISRGRNLAAAHAAGDILAITDAGVTLPDDWLAHLAAPFDAPNPPDVVAGFFRADPHTIFEAAMGATVLPLADEINPDTFLPSSRSVALRRAAFQHVNGYPEWLDYCEDLIFDLQLRRDHKFAFAPDACVAFRPRSDLPAFFKQYYRYARGDGKADLWRKRHAIRYLTYLLAGPLLLILGIRHKLAWLALLAGGIAYLRAPYRRLPAVLRTYAAKRPLRPPDVLRATALVPLIRVVGDVAKMLGYPVGWLWRWRNRPPRWQSRR